MYCRNCGKEISDNILYCPNCGQPTGGAQPEQKSAAPDSATYQYGGSQSTGSETGNYQYSSADRGMDPRYTEPKQYQSGGPYPYQEQPVKSDPDGFAIASLVLGIVSFFIIPIIGSILAIVFGNKSIRENGMNTMARIGRILGIITLILYIIVVVIIIAVVALFGIGAMSGLYYY